MKINRKIIIPFLLFLSIFIATFVYLFIYSHNYQKYIDQRIQNAQRVNDYTNQLVRMREESQFSLLTYQFENTPQNLVVIETNKNRVNTILPQLHKLLTSKKGSQLLANFEKSLGPLRQARDLFLQALQSNDDLEINKYFTIWKARATMSSIALDKLAAYNSLSIQNNELLYKNLSERIFYITIIFMFLTMIFTIGMLFYLRKVLTIPIKEISLASQNIAQGKFNVHLKVHSNDELGELAESLNDTGKKLNSFYHGLRNEIRHKDDFIAMASHELKTPLTSTKLFAQVLLKEFKNDPKAAQALKKMSTQVDKLAALVSEMLDTSRIQKRKLELKNEKFRVKDTLEEIVNDLQTITNHKLVTNWQTNDVIYADKERLRQVITNLITNAIKYSPDKKDIIIRAERQKKMIVVSVQDFGIGISKKSQKRLFERFYQANGSNKSPYSGLGLGLYISRAIIARMGGKMWLESKEGKGSTFYFNMPVFTNA